MASEKKVAGGNQEIAGQEDENGIDMVPLYRKKRVLIPFLLLVLALIAVSVYWYKNLRDYVSTDDAYIDADRISISSKILGRVKLLTVDENDSVSQGQLLVQLDDADLQAQLEQARAGLSFARESMPLAQVNLDRAREDLKRAEVQFKKAVITGEQFSHAQKAFAGARAEYAIALAKIGVAQTQVGLIETQLQNTRIAAPFAGVVAKRWALAGEVVQPGQPIFSIYDLQHVWVTANLEETKLRQVKLGDPVAISVDTYASSDFRGQVREIGTYTAAEFSLIPPNNASGNFTKVTQRVPIKIFLDEQPDLNRRAFPLRPGMSAEIKIKVR